MGEGYAGTDYEAAHTAAIIENELRSGLLADIAATKAILPADATPSEVAEIILPPPERGKSLDPRWTLIEKAQATEAMKAAISGNEGAILDIAMRLGLRRVADGIRQEEDTYRIDPSSAVFVVEGGAMRTSVVRRGVAGRAMRQVYGGGISSKTLYQFGSTRIIEPTKEKLGKDGTIAVVKNPEHETIQELAGNLDFLPGRGQGAFTEFDANLATALAEGYTRTATRENDVAPRIIEMANNDPTLPKLILIQTNGGLGAGLDVVQALIPDPEIQLVIATNGQYRPKATQQAIRWAAAKGIDMLPPVAIGDEPGDTFPYRGNEIVVPDRPLAAYVNELVVLYRLALGQLPDRPSDD